MLSLGKSKPWPEVLKQYTGSEHISTEPIKEYFQPLFLWLREYRKKHAYAVGWGDAIDIASDTNERRKLSNVIILLALFINMCIIYFVQ